MTFFISIMLFLACTPTALFDFAIPKWKADNAVRIEDAYKWLFQATRGGEHAAPDAESARAWLMREWGSLGPAGKDEPVWEPLCSGGEIGRFNLRPFRDRGGKADDLLEAFLASSSEFKSEPASFVAAWDELGRRLKKKTAGALTYISWVKLNDTMKPKNYPAVHHSDFYSKSASPAYRVLTFTQAKKLGL
jgi:hypothetical protein